MASHREDPIIIVGAGWAGLAAALTLTYHNQKVMLLEAAPKAGGRARAVPFGKDLVDNGQHLLIGAYRQTLSLLKWLGISEESVLKRIPFNLQLNDLLNTKDTFLLKFPKLPQKLQLPLALVGAKGLSLKERIQVGRFWQQLRNIDFTLDQDISVLALLNQHQQSERLQQRLWGPLALAALSTPIEQASAQTFLTVLKDTFSDNQADSDFLFPKVDLSELFPEAVIRYLRKKNVSIFYHQRVKSLLIEEGSCCGVNTQSETLRAKSVILATPPNTAESLLPDLAILEPLNQRLSHFQYQPITTVYLRYAKPVTISKTMIGILNGSGHWIFNRSVCQQPDLISVVITGETKGYQFGREALVQQIAKEIQQVNPNMPELIDSRVICEKRAAFSCNVGINAQRPDNDTPLPQLWLAGDYTNTAYPATLEGAVRSGVQAALQILKKTGNPTPNRLK